MRIAFLMLGLGLLLFVLIVAGRCADPLPSSVSVLLACLQVSRAPTYTGDIDALVANMESSLSDDWHPQLLRINERIMAAGECGSRVFSEVNLNGFQKAASNLITKRKKLVTDAVNKLNTNPTKTVDVYERSSWAALSVHELPEDTFDTDSHRDVVEEAESDINELELLLPVDTLLKVKGSDVEIQAETVTVALQCIGHNVYKVLSDVLKKAKRRARDKAFIPTHSLGTELIVAMQQVKALTSVASTLSKVLHHLPDCGCAPLSVKLSELGPDANSFVDGLVKKELEEWKDADTNKTGWFEQFHRHLTMARRLQSLDNEEGHLQHAFAALFQKVDLWQQERFKEATEALQTEDLLQDPTAWGSFVQSCVKQGLAFEQSALCQQLDFPAQFRPLVEKQCEICHQEATSPQQNLKLQTWQKMTTLISALQQLQSSDPRVDKMVKGLLGSREPLNKGLEDGETRFQKHLQEHNFIQAAQLLPKADRDVGVWQSGRDILWQACCRPNMLA